MAGLIDGARTAPEPTSDEQDSGTADQAVTPSAVRSKMNLPAKLQKPYQLMVLACKKLLYSEQMEPQVRQTLSAPGSVSQKIGHGTVMLVGLVLSQTNNTVPPDLIIPVATEMAAEIGDFLRKVGVKVTDHDIAEGMAIMVEEILERAGVKLEQLPQLLAQQGQGAQQAPGPQAAAGAPPVAPDGRVMEGA